MEWLTENMVSVISLLFGTGGIVYAIVMRILDRKKYKAEVAKMQASAKSDEIENMKKAMESVYQPLIADQNKLIEKQSEKINELKHEIETLREEKYKEAEKHREELAHLRDELAEIKRELALKANAQPRDSNGKFAKK